MKIHKTVIAVLGVAILIGTFGSTSAKAAFGIKGYSVKAENEGSSVDLQAGSHPFQFTVSFEMNQNLEEEPEGKLRNLIVNLPAGLVGNPLAVPRCSGALFEGITPACPGDTQVGVVEAHALGFTPIFSPVWNLTPPLGVPASFGFSVANFNSFQEAGVRSSGDYGVNISDIAVPNIPIQSVTERIWGVPADPSHDSERACIVNGERVFGCASELAHVVPFLTLPTSCGAPLATTLSVESIENPGVLESKTALSEEGGVPSGLSDCGALLFEPAISSQPTTNAADSPTGLDFTIHQPQNEEPEGLSTAHLKNVNVTLPQGMTLNPSAANGLSACKKGQIGYLSELHFTEDPQSCPNAARIGTVEVTSPLVDHKLLGGVYVAEPFANPFGSLLAIYLVIEDEQTGVVAKLAGKVTPDPRTGQLTASFRENPQLPIEDIDTHFFGGPQAALKTPLTCGTKTTTAVLVPWSIPEGTVATRADSFSTSAAAGGSGPCPASESQAANRPSFSAGTITPKAGAFSPFVLRISREDGSQQLASIDVTLPPGLVGKLAGIPYCPESAIAQAVSREAPNSGAVEQSSPSCPLSSEVGVVSVGTGAGPSPFHAQGHAYLAGPYRGAPISLEVVVPAVAGPFDLGSVAVRTALYVNESTAQIHAVSDPLPSILQGIPLDVRSIAIDMSKPNFTLNPTSCDPTSVLGSVSTLAAQTAPLSDPFQVGSCASLGFTPKLALSLKGPTKRTGHATLKAVLTAPKGQANIGRVSVVLPKSQFIDQDHINNTCTRPQFAENKCPAKSILGHARAFTPLLDKPLEGPVYFRANGGERELPDLVADLNGQIHVVVVGFNDHVSKKGSEISRIRNTFAAVPDAPVSKFVLELNGGKKKGLIENSENLCSRPQKAEVKMRGQNGKTHDFAQTITTDCGKK